MNNLAPPSAIAKFRNFASSRTVSHSLAAAASQFIEQAVRFGTNVILASLLSPAVFGMLAIVTTVRTGIELLSDMGIKQSIIVSKDGATRPFVETAWGLQIARGAILAMICAALAYPLAAFYGYQELGGLILIAAIGPLLSGSIKPSSTLLVRERAMSRVLLYRVAVAVAASLCTIACVSVYPSAISVVIGGLIGTIIAVALSFIIKPLPGYSPSFDRRYTKKIIHFGKWIFVSSVLFFFAVNFDRIYLPLYIPIAVFGIYNISRSISDVVIQFVNQINNLVLVPAIAQSGRNIDEIREKFSFARITSLSFIAFSLGFLIALSDTIFLFIFDDRYVLGTSILPFLFVGAWFTILASSNESVLMGLGQTKAIAAGNVARLFTSVMGLPLALIYGGLVAVLAIMALSDLPRYLVSLYGVRTQGLAFPHQDIISTFLMVVTAVIVRKAAVSIELVDAMISTQQIGSFMEMYRITY